MKVLIVGKGAPERGGIPTFISNLLSSELREIHELTFLNLAHAGTPEGGRFTVGNLRRTWADVAAVRAAAVDADLVHLHSAVAPSMTVVRAGLLSWAARSRHCAVVLHAHGGLLLAWLRGRRRRALVRVALAPVDKVVAVFSGGCSALREVLGDTGRVVHLPNGVPVPSPRDRHDGDDKPTQILYVGLLTPRKGVLDLATAANILRERGQTLDVVMVGGTPDEGPIAEQEVRSGIGDSAQLLGPRPAEEMPDAYAAADIFCLPSWWEAMPLSILEAMASGLPVVATDVGDVAEVVDHGDTGFVVPPREPGALADALELLLRDEALRRRMGAAGRTRVQDRFSLSSSARELDAIYRELSAKDK